MLFYSNRIMQANVVRDSEELLKKVSAHPEKTWLTSTGEFRKLLVQYPGRIYLIQANSKYAYFTALENRENIRYDFSNMRIPVVK
jgi:hypothetical protein